MEGAEAADAEGAAAGSGCGRLSAPFWPQPKRPAAASSVSAAKAKELVDVSVFGLTATLFWRCNMKSILPAMSATSDSDALSDADYLRKANATLAGIEATIDRWLQDDVIDIDSHRTGGLLELSFPNGSKLVLNTQPPLHELWLAARSGGFHYRLVDGRWLDTRDRRDFFDALSACASEQAGRPLRFDPPAGD